MPTSFKYWIPIQSKLPIQWNTHTHTLSLSLGGVENDSAISHTKCNIYVAVRVHGVRCISYSHQIRLFNFAIEAFIYLF